MKNNFYLFIITFIIMASSCKKQESSTKDKIKQDVELEGDHLAFKDYSTFFDYYKAVGGMNKIERQRWEKSLNFTSMQTAYERFNGELDELEKGSKENYFNGFSNLKVKYNGTLLFTENSYRINNSGISEAILTNKDGFVKVGEDYLHFREKGTTTYKETSFEKAQQLSKSNLVSTETIRITVPSRNSMTSVLGNWYIINKERGRVLFRAKVYNLHSDALGYESFASLEGRAEHLNIFGTWRNVGMSLNLNPRGTTTGVVIGYNNLTNTLENSVPPPIIDPNGGRSREGDASYKINSVVIKPNFFDGLVDVEHFDRVMCITKGLEGNPGVPLSSINGAVEFYNYSVDAKYTDAVDIYWSYIDLAGFRFSAFIQPGGVLGNPAVPFDPFTLDGSLVKNQ